MAFVYYRDIYYAIGENEYCASYCAGLESSRPAPLPQRRLRANVSVRSLCAPTEEGGTHVWIVSAGKGRGVALKNVTPLPHEVATWFTCHELRQPPGSDGPSEMRKAFLAGLLGTCDHLLWQRFLDELKDPVECAAATGVAVNLLDTTTASSKASHAFWPYGGSPINELLERASGILGEQDASRRR